MFFRDKLFLIILFISSEYQVYCRKGGGNPDPTINNDYEGNTKKSSLKAQKLKAHMDTKLLSLEELEKKTEKIKVSKPEVKVISKFERQSAAAKFDENYIDDPVVDSGTSLKPSQSLEPENVFEGLSNRDNIATTGFAVLPPDPTGSVGFKYYVQAINIIFAVYDKHSGEKLLGPFPLGFLFEGLDEQFSACGASDGDPNVLYDQFARKFIISQFTRTCVDPGAYCYQCMAVIDEETLLDDLPNLNVIRIVFTNLSKPNSIGDYPRLSIFDDFYVTVTNDFTLGEFGFFFNGLSIFAMRRTEIFQNEDVMLFVAEIPREEADFGVLLPADNDSPIEMSLSESKIIPLMAYVHEPYSFDFLPGLRIFEFLIDFESDTYAFEQVAFIPVANYQFISCPSASRNCIPQPLVAPNAYVDSLGDRLMHRLAYQNFGDYESYVVVHSVLADFDSVGNNVAATRWYEIRGVVDNENALKRSYSAYQQGTFYPYDSISRWMGSIAQDKNGNIAMGYSVSDSFDVFPGIRFVGRIFNDPRGFMTLGEGTIVDGTSFQNRTGTSARWGDYSSMNIDPEDGCTFFFTSEYYSDIDTCSFCFKTKIASFKLPGCN